MQKNNMSWTTKLIVCVILTLHGFAESEAESNDSTSPIANNGTTPNHSTPNNYTASPISNNATTATQNTPINSTVSSIRNNATTATQSNPNNSTVSSISNNATTATHSTPNNLTVSSISNNATLTTQSTPNNSTVSLISNNATTANQSTQNKSTVSSISNNATTATQSTPNNSTVSSISNNATTTSQSTPNNSTVSSICNNSTTATQITPNNSTISSISSNSTTATQITPNNSTISSNRNNATTATQSTQNNSTVSSFWNNATTATQITPNNSTVSSISNNATTATQNTPNNSTVSSISSNATTATHSTPNNSTVSSISNNATTATQNTPNKSTVSSIASNATTATKITPNNSTVSSISNYATTAIQITPNNSSVSSIANNATTTVASTLNHSTESPMANNVTTPTYSTENNATASSIINNTTTTPSKNKSSSPTESTTLTTTSIVMPITTDPLVSSYNISGHLMYIEANLSVGGNGLTFNETTRKRLVQDFANEMNRLLQNTTGFKMIRVTGVDESNLIRQYRRKREISNTIIIFFELVLLGGSNLTSVDETLPTDDTFDFSGIPVTVKGWGDLKKAVNATGKKLYENVCSVYSSVDKCKIGSFKCNLSQAVITCTHLCHNNNKCGETGRCFYNDIQKETMCRCDDDGEHYYVGSECRVDAYKFALPPRAIIGISAGLGAALLLVIVVLEVRMIRNRKASRTEERSGVDREGESPRELKHYDDLWPHRQLATNANSFDERPYMMTEDNFGSPIYMYRPDDRSEHHYSELKPGSSLSNLNFPESKFEIIRPKIILGR